MDVEEHGHPVAPVAPDYRAISITREGGVAEIRALVALSDEDAIAQTAALVRDLAMDLWDGLRFVEHFAGRVVTTGRGLTPVSGLGGL
jgi:hypothetical protein